MSAYHFIEQTPPNRDHLLLVRGFLTGVTKESSQSLSGESANVIRNQGHESALSQPRQPV